MFVLYVSKKHILANLGIFHKKTVTLFKIFFARESVRDIIVCESVLHISSYMRVRCAA